MRSRSKAHFRCARHARAERAAGWSSSPKYLGFPTVCQRIFLVGEGSGPEFRRNPSYQSTFSSHRQRRQAAAATGGCARTPCPAVAGIKPTRRSLERRAELRALSEGGRPIAAACPASAYAVDATERRCGSDDGKGSVGTQNLTEDLLTRSYVRSCCICSPCAPIGGRRRRPRSKTINCCGEQAEQIHYRSLFRARR